MNKSRSNNRNITKLTNQNFNNRVNMHAFAKVVAFTDIC